VAGGNGAGMGVELSVPLRRVGSVFSVVLPDGAVAKYKVIAHVLSAPSINAPAFYMEEVRMIDYAPAADPLACIKADFMVGVAS